jgi:ATP-binding cassette, subfamily B, multidrug efflux pump
LIKYKYKYLLGFLFLLIVNLIGAYIPLKVKETIDLLQGVIDHGAVNKILLWILFLAIIMSIFRVYSRQIVFSLGRLVEFDLKKDIFNHLMTQEMDYFSKKRIGDLISIISNDVQAIRALSGFAILSILNAFIAFAVTLPPMFALDTNMTIAFLFLIPMAVGLVVLLSKKLKSLQDLVQQRLGDISDFIEQNLSGVTIIKSYAQEENEINRFSKENKAIERDYLRLIGVRCFIGPAMRMIASLGLIILLYFGGRAVINSDFGLGDFAAYSLYVQRLIWPVASFGWLITVLYRAQVSQKRINSVLDKEPVIKDSDDAVEKNDFKDKIELVALNQEIKKSETITIVGTIASGKSFLANQILRLFEVDDDQVKIDGTCIKKIKLSSLRSLINLVPQETFLFSTSIEENIAYAADLSHEEVVDLAKLVFLHDEIESFPSGYETIVGEKGITLSGGQKQRVAIARALALDSEVLIFDDAFSSLDSMSTRMILQNIQNRRKGKTTIFITHKIQVAELSDRIFVMDGMKVVEAGTYQELKSRSGLFSQLLEQVENEKKEV